MTAETDMGWPQIAIGRSADILAAPDGRVVKLFFEDVSAAEITQEEENATKAFELGATPIACHGRISRNGRQGLIFDALEGVSITALSESDPLGMKENSRALARVHVQLNQRSGAGFPSIRERIADLLETAPLAFLPEELRRAAENKIAQLPVGDGLLHMDYHSSNVFQHGRDFAVIDWATALRGPAAADVAATMFLFREAELWPGTPWLKKQFFAVARRICREAYLGEYLSKSGLSQEEVEAWRLPALIHRLGVWDIPAERAKLRKHITALASAAGTTG